MDQPTADTVDRKELLAQQFDAAESAAEPVEAAQSTGPARDESGRFAPRQQAENASQPQAAQSQAAAAPTQTEEPVWKRPPASWKKDYHEPWATVDDRVKEYVWQREEQMRKGVEPLLTKAQFADAMQQAIDPFLPTIRGMGLEPAAAVKALMQADANLRNADPQSRAQTFLQLAQQYGVDLGLLTGQAQQQPQQTAYDPRLIALQNELNSVRGEVVGWKQQQEQAQAAVLQNEIADFAQRAEHFETVRPTMVHLLQTGIAQNLQDAYDKAIRLDPELFDSIQQAQQAQQVAANSAALNKAAKAARAAAVSVRGSTPGTNTAPKAQDRRALLAEQFDGLGSRV